MKKYVFLIGLSLLSLLWLSACTGKAVTENALVFDTTAIESKIALLANQTNPSAELNIRFVYPVQAENDDILATIQNIFVIKTFGELYAHFAPADALLAYELAYTSDYQCLREEYEQELKLANLKKGEYLGHFDFFENFETNIMLNKGGLLSFNVVRTDYTGGAHGSALFSNYVIDLKTGNLLTKEDVFGNNMTELAALLLSKLMEENNMSTPDELNEVGFFDAASITPNDNFLVTGSGITFLYNQYEIAPHVMGAIEVFLPYNEIKGLINKKSPVAILAAL
jgi:hypothetical protein